MAWDQQHLIAEPEGPSFISRTVARRRFGPATLVTHDPEQKSKTKTVRTSDRDTSLRIRRSGVRISSGAQLHARAPYRRPQAPVSTRSCMDVALHLTSWGRGRPHPIPPRRFAGGGRNLLLIMTRCDRPAMHRPAARVSYIWFLLNWSAR